MEAGKLSIAVAPGRLFEEPAAILISWNIRIAKLRLVLRERQWCNWRWWRCRRWSWYRSRIIRRSAADYSDSNSHTIARHAMQVQSHQYVAETAGHVVVQPQSNHVDAPEIRRDVTACIENRRHLTDVLNVHRVVIVCCILRLGGQSIRSLTG